MFKKSFRLEFVNRLTEIIIFRRTPERWIREVLPDDGDTLRLLELEFALPLDAIYARTGL